MKKAIASLFVFLLPVSLCHAADALSVCFDTDGTVIECFDGTALSKKSAGQDVQSENIPTLTYANVTGNHFVPSEVMKAEPVILIPTKVITQEPFVSLKQDAREQVLWPWRDVVEEGPKKLNYNFSIADVTGMGDVRVFNTKVGVEYEVSKNKVIGVEAIRGIQDAQDAEAWGKSAKEEKTAQVKYKIFF